jgi:hypothetical protein
MADEPIKDPTKKSFWRVRNLAWLLFVGIAPLIGHSLWGWAGERIDQFNSLEHRLTEFSRRDVQAVWAAVSEQKDRLDALSNEMALMNRLFDREWGRGTGETEKALTERMRLLDTHLKDLISMQTALDQLVKEHKAKNPDSKIAPVKGDTKSIDEIRELIERMGVQQRPKDTLPYASLERDPASLREQYERRIPAQQKK